MHLAFLGGVRISILLVDVAYAAWGAMAAVKPDSLPGPCGKAIEDPGDAEATTQRVRAGSGLERVCQVVRHVAFLAQERIRSAYEGSPPVSLRTHRMHV
jgi:hypothetical protein